MEIGGFSFSESRHSKNFFERYYKNPSAEFIIAEIGNEIVGYAIGEIKNNSGKFICLAVMPTWRQKGIGTNLVNFLLNFLKKRGAKEIFLNVRTKNKIAIPFYQDIGFKILKETKKYYRNGDNAYLMEREI